MATILFITGDVGPAEGSIYSTLVSSGHVVFTYHTSGRWIPQDDNVPLWMGGQHTRRSPMARNWFAKTSAAKQIDLCISSGLMASSFAARNFDGRVYPLLWRGALDVSKSPQNEAFADVLGTTDRLMLEDPWEMDKALEKHSPLPHLRMRYPTPADRNYLTSPSGDIAIIYPTSAKNEAHQLLRASKDGLAQNGRIELVNVTSLYTSSDLVDGRDLYDALAERLGRFSYAIIVGTGPHHSTILHALQYDADRIVVDQTIGMAELSRDLDLPHRARGLQCVQKMTEVIESPERLSLNKQVSAPYRDQEDFLEVLDELWSRNLEPWFEELPATTCTQPLNIFFSSGLLQDRVNGARHQRVRNMYEAFRPKDALAIYGSSDHSLQRRVRLAQELIRSGRAPGIFYGENSTRPMPMPRADLLAEFLDGFIHQGGNAMWFVRDVHWLGAFDEDPWPDQLAQQLRIDGLHELHRLEEQVDILAAPSNAAGQGFNQLLDSVGEKHRDWFALPPGVQPQNVFDDHWISARNATTVLYAGGISSIYSMDIYLAALRDTDDDVLIDFVVRKPEEPELRDALNRIGLLDSDRVRILNTTMNLYRPRTSQTLGAILMESEYAKHSFPYKTMTMIERGYPIICFKDMGIANFVESNQLGKAVERTEDAIRTGINTLIQTGAPGIPLVRARETWDHRVGQIFDMLADTAEPEQQ
ncbi:hypothetical protein [Yaniella halotolerans]|uniref:hypothetical protein n=1 Tax=Yaniella halotolerans TaxID=225453 RepID=UPI0003B6F185|nr:hypothetical protein [Yaniella halotolerans]